MKTYRVYFDDGTSFPFEADGPKKAIEISAIEAEERRSAAELYIHKSHGRLNPVCKIKRKNVPIRCKTLYKDNQVTHYLIDGDLGFRFSKHEYFVDPEGPVYDCDNNKLSDDSTRTQAVRRAILLADREPWLKQKPGAYAPCLGGQYEQ